MAWDKRGYFYRSRRIGKRVVREYYGKGVLAEAAACLMAELRRHREARAQDLARLDTADTAFQQFHDQLGHALAAHLWEAGFHRHDRGAWRK
jgi:hypothetical protein